ncbi:[protein-PII] uridylyltransferase [Pelistega sp. NLN82]|uniref:Bifunctional uridylyltransferase/uridylyl-removing enzyme n=1 Tax=Pelistega ratti TaxID=2652177 RepID=A0A6L9Y400_9BURK|nr:[protein-PII] uridylyltransferase [Pelistega ratti]NEN75172.1 [protein-PII] uridylyltransferase [Pelistega ratti]
MTSLLEIKKSITQKREQLRERYKKGKINANTFLSRNTRIIDQCFKEVIQQYPLPTGTALCAVGGYGRKELYPYSDIDILLLIAKEPNTADQEKLTQLIQSFWDLGIDIGASIRTIDDCLHEAKKDITVETSLLECRYILGERKTFLQLQKKFKKFHQPRDFFLGKQLEFKQRYARYNNTPYSLEPNGKESPGALRDIHLLHWLALSNNMKGGWKALVDAQLMTAKEAEVITKAENNFKRFRIELQLIHRKRDDRVLFHVQPLLAEVYGHKSIAGKRASESFMQSYYGVARLVNLITHFMLQNFKDYLFPGQDKRITILDEDFQRIGHLLDIREEDAFIKKPHLLLKTFLVLQHYPELEDLSVKTQRLIWEHRKLVDTQFREDPQNQETFLAILQQPTGIVQNLRLLSKLKILPRYIPSWQKIVGQMQHDLFHVYTVDQHILQVIRHLYRFTMPEYAQENPLASRLMVEFDRYWILYIAALFHDIAKGRGGDHSVLGAIDIKAFAQQHRLLAEDIELLEFLVANHLLMSTVAQKKDISDPAVINDFSKAVKTRRHLDALYLLTVADIRGTSPKVWNNWKDQLLQNLYQSTVQLFEGDTFDRQTILSQRKTEAKHLIQAIGLTDKQRDDFWHQMDIAYFLRHEAEDIAWHTQVLFPYVGTRQTIVRARYAAKSDHIQIVVFTPDQPHLFEKILAYFYQHHLNILDARIHTSIDGYALDSFSISFNEGENPNHLIHTIEKTLVKAIQQENLKPPKSFTTKVGAEARQSRIFPIVPSITLRKDEYGSTWLLSITTTDCPGILYHLAHLLSKHHINLHMAKIMTLGERAEDIFIIESPYLDNEKNQLSFERDILDTLNHLIELK